MDTRTEPTDRSASVHDQTRALALQMHAGFETLNRRLGTIEATLVRIERSLDDKPSRSELETLHRSVADKPDRSDLQEIEKILHQKPDRAEIKDENRTLVLIVVSVATLFAGLFTAMQALL